MKCKKCNKKVWDIQDHYRKIHPELIKKKKGRQTYKDKEEEWLFPYE